jgi:hypothetical protein
VALLRIDLVHAVVVQVYRVPPQGEVRVGAELAYVTVRHSHVQKPAISSMSPQGSMGTIRACSDTSITRQS